MCDYTGNDFGAHYDDAACRSGFLWDLDGDGWVDGDFEHPCPKCNTVAFLDGAKEDAENTSWGSFQMIPYCGAMILEGAIKKARKHAPEATAEWVRQIPQVVTYDWPDREAVFAGRAAIDLGYPRALETATI